METVQKLAQGERAERLAEMLRTIAHPVRLKILAVLVDGDATVTQLVAEVGVRQSAVSQHLSGMRLLGLVSVKRTGHWATYTLAEPGLRDLFQCLANCHK